jgi:threonine aldolase
MASDGTKMSTIRPAVETDYTSDQLEAAAAAMAAVLAQEPELSDYGYGDGGVSKTPEERVATFRTNRQSICEPGSLAQFLAARQWCGGPNSMRVSR